MKRFITAVTAAVTVCAAGASSASAIDWREDPPEFLSAGGMAALYGPWHGQGEFMPGAHDNGRGGNTFVNDPCLDPPPTAPPPENRRRTVQSETEIAVLNKPGVSMGKKMVAGYNDSYGFYNKKEGLSGFSYSTDGGNKWIDGGGLPPRNPAPDNNTEYFGDPVVVVHHQTETFYFSSIYQNPDLGYFTLSVNRGRFKVAPPQGVESISNTRCYNDITEHGVPDPPKTLQERVIWDPPVEAVKPPFAEIPGLLGGLLDKEWLHVDQRTGTLYLTYTRFTNAGQTQIEMVRCVGCAFLSDTAFQTASWTVPSIVVGDRPTAFDQASFPITTPTGRVIVVWNSRQGLNPPAVIVETRQIIEMAFSDDDGQTFSLPIEIAEVRQQAEPPGYNRARNQILNAPYVAVDLGIDDGVVTAEEASRPGFGNVYVTYFDACARFQRCANIRVSRSTTNGMTWDAPVKVNDDPGTTSHVFPSVQVNKHGFVYVAWLDRRNDPIANALTDLWANVSKDAGTTYGPDRLQTDIATNWFVRADARPNFGDYNSSELLGFNDFVTIWADGRFRPPGGEAATPDAIFTIANGLGVGTLSK